jgi:hypothetical protein
MKRLLLVIVSASACTVDVYVGNADGPTSYAASCAAPDGPVHPYATADEARQLLTATWIYCSGDDVLDGSTQVGIAFGSDMIFHDLEDVGSGAYVEDAGTSDDTWAIEQASPSAHVELFVTTEFSGNQLDEAWSMTFEDSPRKVLVTRAGESEPSSYAIAP